VLCVVCHVSCAMCHVSCVMCCVVCAVCCVLCVLYLCFLFLCSVLFTILFYFPFYILYLSSCYHVIMLSSCHACHIIIMLNTTFCSILSSSFFPFHFCCLFSQFYRVSLFLLSLFIYPAKL